MVVFTGEFDIMVTAYSDTHADKCNEYIRFENTAICIVKNDMLCLFKEIMYGKSTADQT